MDKKRNKIHVNFTLMTIKYISDAYTTVRNTNVPYSWPVGLYLIVDTHFHMH